MRRLPILLFCFSSALLLALAFPGSLSGRTILAPVDIFPNLFKHFHYMNPAADGIPENHHIIDQATYDLPLQYRIYESIRAGTLPWWDPYTYGGRPLLADAHINGTDPVRLLCYFTASFPFAYNLNLILKSMLTGLALFLLLRHLGHGLFLSGLLALAFQFAGCFALFFGHPWIQASFLYYPLLWISLDRWVANQPRSGLLLTSLLCALIFYSGNLQSHTYLLVFMVSYVAASFLKDKAMGNKALAGSVLGLAWGGLLAAPVLLSQVEFFFLSARPIFSDAGSRILCLRGPMSLSGVFPWILGTFRTLDLSKAVNSGSLGFCLFVGTTPFLLALLASRELVIRGRKAKHADWVAGFLFWGYLTLISTPLEKFFYTRLSPLACVGLVVLAASASRQSQSHDPRKKRASFPLLMFLALLVFVLWAGELAMAQRFSGPIRAFFFEKLGSSSSSVISQSLRSFQFASWQREIGWSNPEVALSWAAWAFLLAYFWGGRKIRTPIILCLSLAFSFAAVFLFYKRYTPCQPVALWESLLKGGPSQQAGVKKVSASHGRLYEASESFQDKVFPNAVANLYGVHVVHGYSALQPNSLYQNLRRTDSFPNSWVADWQILSDGSMQPFPQESPRDNDDSCRFIWEGPGKRDSTILQETPCRLVLQISAGSTGQLIRTDTDYPGWHATVDAFPIRLESLSPCFSSLQVPNSSSPVRVSFDYRPRTLTAGLMCMALGSLGMAISLLVLGKLDSHPGCRD